MQEIKQGTILWVLQEVAKYESALTSCAIEGNKFGEKHLRIIKGMELVDKYKYLKQVFDLLEEKYNWLLENNAWHKSINNVILNTWRVKNIT